MTRRFHLPIRSGDYMAGGGHAPKVAVHEVAALIGAVLLISSLTLLFIPVTKQAGVIEQQVSHEDGEAQPPAKESGNLVALDLLEGDGVSLKITVAECLQVESYNCVSATLKVYSPGGEKISSHIIELERDGSDEFKFKANQSGTYEIDYEILGSIEWEVQVERRWMQPYLMPLLGAGLLGWGVWQGQQMAAEEDDEEDEEDEEDEAGA
jgi:hypothetical protein